MLDLSKVIHVPKVIAHRSGELLYDEWKTEHDVIKQHSGRITNETRAKLDNYIIEKLREVFPDHNYLSAHDKLNNKSKYNWFISSLDGSKYYYREIPLFSVAIGLVEVEEPVLGVVYNPISQQLYWGHKGLNFIYRNHSVVNVDKTNDLKESIVGIEFLGINDQDDDEKKWTLEKSFELNMQTYRTRNYGCSSLCLSWVASGGLDLFIDLTGNRFDTSTLPGLSLINAAGGYWEYVDVGFENQRLVAGLNRNLVQESIEFLRQ